MSKTEATKKRRIHISAHPADRYLYFDRVMRAVELVDGCVAAFCPFPNDTGCDLPEDADTLVVLASVKYFVWQNSGFQSEFLRAKERGVRVVPILLEKEAINLLNMRLGKLQYIDATADGFDFALDELYAHLANPEPRAVDESLPSVFISYRKSDGEHLSDILKIIEGSPKYGSFNLWYDRIIYPGDNYSTAILRALTECDLFILLVSPAVLEEGNYVMRVEYPEARKLGKRILPVEILPTDRAALAEKFPDLPKCVSIKQVGAIHSAIGSMINR